MKNVLTILILVFGFVHNLLAQNVNNDFIIVDVSIPDAEQIKEQYSGQAGVYIILATQVKAPAQITAALHGKQVADLHLFVSAKPGTLGFCNMALNPENLQEQASVLSQWKSHVSGNVVIHNSDVFLSQRGLDFKTKLEQITGLTFLVQ
jgi:hypothetical protein